MEQLIELKIKQKEYSIKQKNQRIHLKVFIYKQLYNQII